MVIGLGRPLNLFARFNRYLSHVSSGHDDTGKWSYHPFPAGRWIKGVLHPGLRVEGLVAN